MANPIILVRAMDAQTYEVEVAQRSATRHQVILREAYFRQLCGGRTSPETLIEKSFEFLLEREPNTAILTRFDLGEIGSYYPEFERTMRKWISGTEAAG